MARLAAAEPVSARDQLDQHSRGRLPAAFMDLDRLPDWHQPPGIVPSRADPRDRPRGNLHRAISLYVLRSEYPLARRGRGIALRGRAVSAVRRCSAVARAGLADRARASARTGARGWLPFRAINVLSRLRARFLPARAHIGGAQWAAVAGPGRHYRTHGQGAARNFANGASAAIRGRRWRTVVRPRAQPYR